MSDEEAVQRGIDRAVMRAGGDHTEEIDDGTARTIASWHHAPDNSPAALRFYADGSITTDDADSPFDAGTEVYRGMLPPDLYDTLSPFHRTALSWLGTYLLNREDRGPVAGWTRLWAV